MFDAKQARVELVQPVLFRLDPVIPYSKAAENLLLGTMAHESHGGTYLAQIEGPALGVYQMEPETHRFHVYWLNGKRRKELHEIISQLACTFSDVDLVWNLAYATCMARIHYWRVREALPQADDLNGLAAYWKRYYNTAKGKGTVEGFIAEYRAWVR